MKSASSSPGSPPVTNGYAEGLYAKWQLTDASKLRTPISNTINRLGMNREDSVDDVDDDLFGSAAWRRKRGKRPKAKEENRTDAENRARRKKEEGVLSNLTRNNLQTLKDRICSVSEWVMPTSRRLSLPEKKKGGRLGTAIPTANGAFSKPSPARGGYELTTESLVHQARLLCGNYIYQRLSSKGLLSKRVNVSPYENPLADEIFSAGQELERMYPKTYTDVSRRISMTMTSAQIVRRALTSVLDGIFSTGVSWAKVVSMMAIAAAFAEECVVQGHPNFVEDVVMCVGHFVTMHLTIWLAQQGGWAAFPSPKKPETEQKKEGSLLLGSLATVFVASVLLLIILKVVFDGS
ncbi:hypothetical protein BaRGS_00030464 [Batillaria attramentaria]|uniref:Bcl-2 Bcl-2 homology region 1-3 domain-containing protein n=1 Tax=Batillaria attramentaria TaxID=370345 RepID=A0ABD0JTF0_9CAEN